MPKDIKVVVETLKLRFPNITLEIALCIISDLSKLANVSNEEITDLAELYKKDFDKLKS